MKCASDFAKNSSNYWLGNGKHIQPATSNNSLKLAPCYPAVIQENELLKQKPKGTKTNRLLRQCALTVIYYGESDSHDRNSPKTFNFV